MIGGTKMKSALVICRGGFIGNPQQKRQGEEPLLPIIEDYSSPEKSPAGAQHGVDDNSNILLPCFINGL
jgi:hypothetical protein